MFLKTGTALALAAAIFSNVSAQTTQTLRASNAANSSSGYINWQDAEAGDPSQCKGGGFWNQTYGNNGGFKVGNFSMSHNSGFDIYSYWGGFTTGSNGDNLCYTTSCTQSLAPCAGSGSDGWVYNQWGVMAGGGLNASGVATQGLPYFIGYWDYFSEGIDPNSKSLQISLADNNTFTLQSLRICNHPWPYYGNIYGNGFSRPFNQPGDYFRLIVHGVRNNGPEVTYPITLASTNSNGILSQDSEWKLISFPPTVWRDLQYIYFTMESSDELVIGGFNYGPNTAVYFCMDDITVTKSNAAPSKTTVRQAQRSAQVASPAVEVTKYFPVASVSGGKVAVYDANGKEVLNMSVEAGEKINLSMLPAGEYRLQHGHKVIPVSKK
ncbi:MAG: DUF4465 domain-containing protein [Prevotellaceae bacterium]|nr:DUF4465 domain-containing protein [Prevotellaceae bacterium]